MENTKKPATHPKKARYTSQKTCYTCRYTSKKLAIHAAIHPKSLLYICYTSLPSLILVARIRYTLRYRCDTLAIHCYTWQCPPHPPPKKNKKKQRTHAECAALPLHAFFYFCFFPYAAMPLHVCARHCRCMKHTQYFLELANLNLWQYERA